MSHLPERKEKACLNCGTTLTDRYCQHCGQENLEPKESFWHLLKHFLEDLTHFDGKLFSTLKYLLFRPGFLTKEYIAGRRASYLNPIRMYLFISALFFLLLMSILPYQTNKTIDILNTPNKTKTVTVNNNIHITRKIIDSLDTKAKDSTTVFEPKTLAQYDSQQKTLAPANRDNGFESAFARKMFLLKDRSKKEGKAHLLKLIVEKFAHSLPYLLFISVPLIALLFQLIYMRHKEFFYVSNIIFTLHYYCLYFLAHMITECLDTIGGYARPFSFLVSFISIAYLYIAMLNFYNQGWFKTLLKYFFILIFSLTIVGILFGVDLLFSIWTIA